jgi:hypothetical protein
MLFIFLNRYLHCCAVMEENNPTRPCLFSYEIILFPQGNTCILATLKRACLHVPLFFLKYALISSREIEVQLCKIPREKSMSSVAPSLSIFGVVGSRRCDILTIILSLTRRRATCHGGLVADRWENLVQRAADGWVFQGLYFKYRQNIWCLHF